MSRKQPFEGKLLILDFDGTSLDSELLVVLAWVKVFERLDPKRILPLNVLESFSGPPLLDSCKVAFPDLDPEYVRDVYCEVSDCLYETYASLFPGELEALKELKEKGCKLALNTNKMRKQTMLAVSLFGLEGIFDEIFAGGDGKMKPDPEGVNALIERCGVRKEDTVYLGDSIYDLLTARNAGIDCFMVDFYPRDLRGEIPEARVRSYAELSSILESWWK